MSIKFKIIFIVLPLLIATLLLTGISSYFLARTGITRVANDFLGFKTEELKKNAEYQWNILLENNLTNQSVFIEGAKAGILSFAKSLIKRPTELILAFDDNANLVLETNPIEIRENEKIKLKQLVKNQETKLVEPVLNGISRVSTGFYFQPFKWYFLVTEQKDIFYQEVNWMTSQSLIILGASLLVALILLWIFAVYLTRPLIKVVATMKDIIKYNDLSERVPVEYKDETGELAHTFNIMIGELDKYYNLIKRYAFDAVLAQKKEQKIRSIFQRYVPNDVIDQVLAHTEGGMLTGENRVLAILFSDIRNFTSISESMKPEDLVEILNRYFEIMVNIIYGRKGIVDKYVGDAIMAFFGAPVKHPDDALQSVLAALEMLDAVKEFHKVQRQLGISEFHIGIGINYGVVTVGNIGSERKMDYTVIGDMVNLASRLEGLTKMYHQELIISESLRERVVDNVFCRMLDKVAVKGKSRGVNIYAAKKELTDAEKNGWKQHGIAMRTYYELDFGKAKDLFKSVKEYMPDDFVADLFIEKCNRYIKAPPGPDWDGIEIMTEK
jgi:adenylate cyclase